MRSYEERAKDFIAEVFPFIKDHYHPWDVEEPIYQFNHSHSRNVEVYHGCARVALVTSDYVIKWDYDNDEVDEIGGCENEIELYSLAEKDGFAYLFAKISRYRYGDRNFYIMPRIKGIGQGGGYAEKWMTPQEYKWCKDHCLVDLHSNNYGFRNKHVCIVDYGFVTTSSCISFLCTSREVSES